MSNFLWFTFSFGGTLITGFVAVAFVAKGEYFLAFLAGLGLVFVGVVTFWSLRNKNEN